MPHCKLTLKHQIEGLTPVRARPWRANKKAPQRKFSKGRESLDFTGLAGLSYFAAIAA